MHEVIKLCLKDVDKVVERDIRMKIFCFKSLDGMGAKEFEYLFRIMLDIERDETSFFADHDYMWEIGGDVFIRLKEVFDPLCYFNICRENKILDIDVKILAPGDRRNYMIIKKKEDHQLPEFIIDVSNFLPKYDEYRFIDTDIIKRTEREIKNMAKNSDLYAYMMSDVEATRMAHSMMYKPKTPKQNAMDKIKNVIFNNPATIVFWSDGSKTVVKAAGEPFDPGKGLAMAIAKYFFDNQGYYNDIFKKWLPKEEKTGATGNKR